MQKTNPEILQIHNPTTQPLRYSREMTRHLLMTSESEKRCRCRSTYKRSRKTLRRYCRPNPSTVWSSRLSKVMKGWGFPYEQWPQDLKDEYTYNPTAARQLLADAGYPNGFKTNIVVDIAGDKKLLKICHIITLLRLGLKWKSGRWNPMPVRPLWERPKYDQLVYRQYGPFGHCYGPFRAINRFHTGNQFMMVSDPVIDDLLS